MTRRGKQIKIPYIEAYNGNGQFTKLNCAPFRGRPTKVIKHLLEFCFTNDLFKERELYEDIIYYGFDKGYISDGFLAAISLKYFVKDMDWTKYQRLKELEMENNGTEIRRKA